MATEIKIPTLGEGIEGGDIVTLHVKAGDEVSEGQALLELETGKATVEVPAPAAGTLESLDVGEGDKVAVGDVIGALSGGDAVDETAGDAGEKDETGEQSETEETAGDSEDEATEEGDEAPEDAGEGDGGNADGGESDLLVPELGEGVEGGDVVTLHVAEGETVEEDQTLFELETGKATVEVPARSAGTISSLSIQEGDKVKVGDKIGILAAKSGGKKKVKPVSEPKKDKGETEKKRTQPAGKAPEPTGTPLRKAVDRPAHAPIPAAPSVRKFAREIGVEIAEVPGSGPKGRVSMADVKAWSKQLHNEKAAAAPVRAAAAAPARKVPLPDFSSFGEIEREKMTAIRKMTVEHMDTCWGTIPHVTQFDEADVTDLEALRKSFQPKAEKAGTKLTMTAMLIKILGSALKAFPNFNASLDLDKEEVVLKKYFNVGCAVDTPKGLVVPVIRGVDGKNMIEISKDLGDAAAKMREGKISPSELQGGCITLSNLGGLGGKHFTPIVNGPEVAILGVGRAAVQPVWRDGEFAPRMMMPLSLSYDHRLIDGADGTRFMRWIVDAIEQPLLISLEG